MNRRRRLVIIFTVALGFFATACGSAGQSGPVDSASESLVDEFELLDGTTIDLASLQGEDVVLWFWAPW